MKVFYTVFHDPKIRELSNVDSFDIWTKRYTMRIRLNGIRVIRHKKGFKHRTVLDKTYNFGWRTWHTGRKDKTKHKVRPVEEKGNGKQKNSKRK